MLRGLPGSGKSHAARRLRDAEVAAGGDAPRIHSIDDYFVTVSCQNGHSLSCSSTQQEHPVLARTFGLKLSSCTHIIKPQSAGCFILSGG